MFELRLQFYWSLFLNCPIDNIPALVQIMAWWRHQMETFSALLVFRAGNSPVTAEFPAQKPVTRSFDVFFDLRLNKQLSKQPWDCWFETPSRSLWRQCNGLAPSSRQNIIWINRGIDKWRIYASLGIIKLNSCVATVEIFGENQVNGKAVYALATLSADVG